MSSNVMNFNRARIDVAIASPKEKNNRVRRELNQLDSLSINEMIVVGGNSGQPNSICWNCICIAAKKGRK